MLADRLRPCGPVLDKARAADLLESLGETGCDMSHRNRFPRQHYTYVS